MLPENDQEFSAEDLATLETPASDTDKASSDKPAGSADDTGATSDKSSKVDGTNVWGENWRDTSVQGLGIQDEKERKAVQDWLAKRGSPFDVIRGAYNADKKISEITRDRVKIPTGKNDDPKEVAAYRKAMGIPEKPEDYKIEYGEGIDPESIDKELEAEVRKGAIEVGASQKQVEFFSRMHWAIRQREQAAESGKIAIAKEKAIDELRTEFGKEYKPTVELINRMFATELAEAGLESQEERTEFLSKRFADGMAIGEHPAFVKMMAKIARERADDGAFDVSDTGEGGEDLDSKIDKIVALSQSDPKEYARMQPELKRLIAVQNRRKSK